MSTTEMNPSLAQVGSKRRCGAVRTSNGTVRWRVWAPFAQRMDLVLFQGDRRVTRPMRREDQEFFVHEEQAEHGQRYALRLDGGDERPDPCALWQPGGLPGPSAIVFPEQFRWTDTNWRGVQRSELVLYELHVGTFTQEGTFDAIVPRLADLKELGITAIELLPIAQFSGERNWGYDGVLPYAAQHSYGGPEALARLVDAAHGQGIAVVLDVVYNHFGPEFAFFHEFGPYLTDKYKTPWGKAINYDDAGCDPVRDFVLDNARMWLEEFHLDGLRLDAVHAIYDMGARHILRAIADVAAEVSQRGGRAIHIIGESDLNDPRTILPPERGGIGLDAQWSDDFHHAVHALLTGERRGYYADYGQAEQVARSLANPFVFAWDYSPHRRRKHGAPLPPDVGGDRFVVCIQNHDQVGNRARGDRPTTLLDAPAKQRLASSILLLSPYLPLLFMGEEYGETRPFPFFCSFCGEELLQAVREGRKREFADFVEDASEIPDPAAVETFKSAKLTWQWPAGTLHAGLRSLYRDLLSARKRWPVMQDLARRTSRVLGDPDQPAVIELIRGEHSAAARCYFNVTDRPQRLPGVEGGNGVAVFSSESTRYGGDRHDLNHLSELRPFECVVFGSPDWWRPGERLIAREAGRRGSHAERRRRESLRRRRAPSRRFRGR